MGAQLSQIFPPTPTLTETNLPSQRNRVFLVTGGYSGIGYHISRILYHAGGTVYIAGRDEAQAQKATAEIKTSPKPDNPSFTSPGRLEFLSIDLSDFSTIQRAASAFLAQESQLNVLFHNAGISLPPSGSASAQGHELTLATNCLGPFLLNHFLTPALVAASKRSPPGSTRVVWTASQVVDFAPAAGGMDLADLDHPPKDRNRNYANSKAGNYFLASEFSRRSGMANGILSITANPGALKTRLLRHTTLLFRACVRWLLWDAVYGAYTMLWAGVGGEVRLEEDGGKGWVVPWGRRHPRFRGDLLECLEEQGEGGNGTARRFWEWCEGRCKDWM